MSSTDPFVAGGSVLSFHLQERVGAAVWRAEDTRNGRMVALKILTRQLPHDPARRDTVIRDLRLGAALYHASLVTIIEIVPAGDALVMVMDWFDGLPVASAYRGRAADRGGFFRAAYQLADVVHFLNCKNVLHLNIAGDSVLVAANGQIKLAGLNAATFLPRRDGQGSAFSQKGSDADAVSYMAPEQITNQSLTAQTDVFSMGVVMYEIATGRRPYLAASAPEVARKIIDEQPPSPKAVNPTIDGAVLNVLGKCFFKDPYRRHKDAKAILDDIVKVDGDVVAWSNDIARSALTAVADARHAAQTRQSILLVADVANYHESNAVDPVAAGKAAARMQQLLGEAVYLFDGQVVDPFGNRFVGELTSVENGLEAARKGEFDFSPEQQEGDGIPVRMLLHYGEVETRNGAPAGAAVDKAFEILAKIDPAKLCLTESFLKKGRVGVRLRDAGAVAGVKLFALAPSGEAAEEAARAAAAEEEEARLVAEAEATATRLAKKRKQTRYSAIVAAAVIVVGGASALLWIQKHDHRAAPVAIAKGPAVPSPATAATPRKIAVEPFTIEPADATLQHRAEAVRLAAIEILRSFPEVRVVGSKGADVRAFSARLTGGAAAPVIVPATDDAKPAQGQAAALIDASSGIQAIVSWIASDLKIPSHAAASADTYNMFADAVAADAAKEPNAESAVRKAAKADEHFLPAQLLAFRFFDAKGNANESVAAAKQIIALDPTNIDAARRVARASIASGDLSPAFNAYAAVLQRAPADTEALNMVGRYALAAGDNARFSAAVNRLGSSDAAAVHTPDALVASGRIDNAAGRYYDVEQLMPHNAALSLKIGRIAVLRHSNEIAGLELAKLEQLDPNYGAHVLKAYLAAAAGDKPKASAELKIAEPASRPGDDYWTSTADIAAMNGDARGVSDALDRAAARKEPTASYVLASPLFGFLQSDGRFLRIREKLTAQQNEIRAALAPVKM